MKYLDIPLSHFTELMKSGQVFSFSRWGDGEWIATMNLEGKEKKNCDGHAYFPEMGKMLQAIIKSNPPYFMALPVRAMGGDKKHRVEGTRKEWYSWMESNRIYLTWHESVIFHEASWRGELNPFIQALKMYPVILVGPPHLRRLNSLFRYKDFIEVPEKNCFTAIDGIEKQIKIRLEKIQGILVLSLSCAMSANILIDRLYPLFGDRCFMIDFGSLWDPYVGIKSRRYHHRMAAEFTGQC